MSARTVILGRLKSTLDTVHNPTVRYSRADQCIKEAGTGSSGSLIPERGRAEGPAKTALFVNEAERAEADVYQLARLADVPTMVAGLLKDAGVDEIKIAPEQTLQALDWSGAHVDATFGRGVDDDHVGLALAQAGVAETGTLVMYSGPDAPTTLNFLPDVHIVVLREQDIAANYEQVWAQLRRTSSSDAGFMPRTVNWITGPSRTADIEQTLLLGAHGPRKLIILLIDAEIA